MPVRRGEWVVTGEGALRMDVARPVDYSRRAAVRSVGAATLDNAMIERWTPEQHSHIGELFQAVCDLDLEDQTRYLDRACRGEARLRAQVESLLQEDSRAEDFLAGRSQRWEFPEVANRVAGTENGLPSDGVATEVPAPRFRVQPEKPGTGFPSVTGYQILGVLGHGGMGVVYRAVQLDLKREVALKILPALVGAANPDAVDRFKREAAAAARLRHKNIVPIYDFGHVEAGYYYSMEWIRGVSLDAAIRVLAARTPVRPQGEPASPSDSDPSPAVDFPWLRPGELPFESAYFRRVATWTREVGDALQTAHEQGVIHRDIKPGNLIVAADGRIMVTDFGLAKSDRENTMTAPQAIMGTLRYLSPEQALGRRVPIDHRADIYSLGATLYALLTLHPIFEGLSDRPLLAAVITQEPARPTSLNPHIPRDLETICLKMLEKLPGSRYVSAQALSADLAAYLEGRPITGKRRSVFGRIARSARRRVKVLLVGTLLVVASVIFAVQVAGRRQAVSNRKIGALSARINDIAQVDTLISEGLGYQQAKQWDRARETYERAIALDPSNVRALGNLAIVAKERYDRGGGTDDSLLAEALDYCERALAIDPERAALWNVEGVLLKMRGDLPEASNAYNQALAVNDTPPAVRIAVLNNLAEAQWLAGEADAAERSLLASTELAVESGTAAWYTWCDLASFQLSRGDPEAVESIGYAFDDKADPGWRLHVIRARIFLELDGFQDAEQALRDALAAEEQSGSDARLERVIALAYLRSDRYEEAVSHANTALALGDRPAYARVIAAIAQARMGDVEGAAQSISEAKSVWPTDLLKAGYVVASARGMLWFDTADQFRMLWQEAEGLIHGDP